MRILTTLLLLSSLSSLAQGTDTVAVKDSSAIREKNHFIIGATYNSGMNYYGRVDSLRSRGVYPFIGFAAKNGLYLNATFVFLHNSLQSQYAATLLEGGYNFKNQRGNWAGSISATGYFYRDHTDLPQSAIKGSAAASITNLNKIINVTLGGDAKFSDHMDIGAQAGLDHIIRFPNVLGKGVIVLDPSAFIYAGTQNFTETYYQKKNLLFVPVAEEEVTKNSKAFNILAYELSMPIVYGYKKINLIFSPAYILPQHILSVPGQTGLSEHAENLFYLMITMKVTL
ncbi:MAG TPA: hypothetical protein VL832_06995 [Puia sp.]|nr:hypothetical protein [Puia sp.]